MPELSQGATLIGQIVLMGLTVMGFVLKERQDQKRRDRARDEQETRADELRRTTEGNARLLADALAHRHMDLAQRMDENTQVTRHAAETAEKAYEAANNFNVKWSVFRAEEKARAAATDHEHVEVALDTNERVKKVEKAIAEDE